MTAHRRFIEKSVNQDLRLIPPHDLDRILKRVGSLAGDPHPVGSEKLPKRTSTGCVKATIELFTKSKTRT